RTPPPYSAPSRRSVAVDDPMWWRVWWPWLVLWSATLVALLAAVWVLVAQWREDSRRTLRRPDLSFYPTERSIMGLYQQYRYQAALKRAVREEITRSKNATVEAAFAPLRGRTGWQVDSRTFREYIEIDQPITVIGIIMNVLERTDDIVYV